MIQEMITYLIIITALIYIACKAIKTGTAKYKYLPNKKNKPIVHNNCNSCTSECILRGSVIIYGERCKSKRETTEKITDS